MVKRSENLNDHLVLENVLLGVTCNSKQELLTKLSDVAARSLNVDARIIFEALIKREHLGSTGIGSGVAVPHACVEGIERSLCLFAHLSRPVDFDAIDDVAVDIVATVLSPPSRQRQGLNVLSMLANRLRDSDVRSTLRAARTETDIRECLT